MTFLLITRQLICAPNVRSVKGDAARTRKKSTSSWFMLRIRSASPLTQRTLMRHCFNVCTASLNGKVIAYSFCWRERKRKYDFYSKNACSNCKYTSIAPVRDHCLTFASFPTPIVSRFHLPTTPDSGVALHCKQMLPIFPSPGGMSLTKLSLAGNILIIPG
jgi:hypothetical protein